MKKALYLSLLVMLLSTCKKDTSLPEPENFYYYLTKGQLNKTPYFTNPKFDTLTFISNKSDTLVFAKAGTDTFWHKECDCPPWGNVKFYHYQQLRNRYLTLKGVGNFEVLHRKNNDAVEFKFNGIKTYGISDQNIGYKFSNSYFDSVSINGLIYRDLLKLPVKPFHYFYINVAYGVFHIKDTVTNEHWSTYRN